MPEDSRISIILGRPFLATARAMIDVFNKKITLRVGDDEDLEKSINQSDLESCNSIGDKFVNNSDVEMSIRRIDPVNTPYSEAHETEGTDRVKNKHLYSANANEIDEKRPELKDLPSRLEYEYIHGFFQISIATEDQEKTTFTCPYGTFAYWRIPKQYAKPRLIRWVWLLQRLNIEIKDKNGAENLATDHLSRLENPHMEVLTEMEIVDEFLYEHLMVLKSKFNDDEPWYADFINYIVGKVILTNWTFKKRKRCVSGSETLEILAHCHSGPTGGHHSALVTAKIRVRILLP
nr:hypothetical protein [Tanacetum cinerariifolium]